MSRELVTVGKIKSELFDLKSDYEALGFSLSSETAESYIFSIDKTLSNYRELRELEFNYSMCVGQIRKLLNDNNKYNKEEIEISIKNISLNMRQLVEKGKIEAKDVPKVKIVKKVIQKPIVVPEKNIDSSVEDTNNAIVPFSTSQKNDFEPELVFTHIPKEVKLVKMRFDEVNKVKEFREVFGWVLFSLANAEEGTYLGVFHRDLKSDISKKLIANEAEYEQAIRTKDEILEHIQNYPKAPSVSAPLGFFLFILIVIPFIIYIIVVVNKKKKWSLALEELNNEYSAAQAKITELFETSKKLYFS
jgi:hypothetical protein